MKNCDMLVLAKGILIILMWFGVVIVGSAEMMSPRTIDKSDEPNTAVEEYFFEHKVNDIDAAAAFKQRSDEIINSKFFTG